MLAKPDIENELIFSTTELDADAEQSLLEFSRLARLNAICSLAGITLLVILLVRAITNDSYISFLGSIAGSGSTGFYTILFLFLAGMLLAFVFLLMSGIFSLRALKDNDTGKLNQSLKMLKYFFILNAIGGVCILIYFLLIQFATPINDGI